MKNLKQIRKNLKPALVNYQDYKAIVKEVETHRKERLVALNDFLNMSKEKNEIYKSTNAVMCYLAGGGV